jgi:hypothetical protein
MFHRKSHDGSPRRLISYIRWWVLLACLVLTGAGLLILLFHISEATKYFVAGALVGAGCGGGLNEVVSAPDRRESSKRLDELRGTVVPRYRLAYKMGDFVFNFYAALSKGDKKAHDVETFLDQGEVLGIRTSLTLVVENSDPSLPSLFNNIRMRVDEALSLSGENLNSFFEIGQNLHALRGRDAKERPELRGPVAANLARSLKDIEGLADGVDPSKAWENIYNLWNKDDSDPKEIDGLLTVFHLFFFTLEENQNQYEKWKAILIKVSKMKTRDGRPRKLTPVMEEIRSLGI